MDGLVVPGPKTTFSLQAPTQTRTATGGVTNAWVEQTTFRGSLEPISVDEVSAFGREAEIFTHLSIIGYEEIGDSFVGDLIAKNRVVSDNSDNQLDNETFDIVAVEAQRYPGNTIATFEIRLRKVD